MSGVKQQLLAILLFLSFTLVTMPKGELPPPCLPSRLLFLHPPRSLLQHCGSVDSGPTLSLLPKSTAGVVFSNPSFFDPPKALWGDHGELDDPPDSPDHALGLCADGVELKVERASTPAKPLYFIFTLFTLLPQLSTDVGHLVVIGRTSMLGCYLQGSHYRPALGAFSVDLNFEFNFNLVFKLVFNPVFTLSSSLSPACRQNYRVDCDVAPKPVLVLDATSGKVVLLLLVIAGAGTRQPVKHLSSSGK
ncbi:hypothetical protein BDZ89DRAFT_1144159 [Hymenopellis radicata]|nr:hypothetical protein BDZ89DRAFT_1144159 [Hymenopellis radicata]